MSQSSGTTATSSGRKPHNLAQGYTARGETPLGVLDSPFGADADVDVHRFLLRRNEKSPLHPAEAAILIRDSVEGFSSGQGTFQIKNLVDDGSDLTRTGDWESQIKLAGGWRAGDIYIRPESNIATRWANPNYRYSERYSDALVKCECGTIVAHPERRSKSMDLPHDDVDDHGDDCRADFRHAAAAKLFRNRRDIMLESAYYGWTGVQAFARMGIPNQSTISHLARAVNVDYTAEKEKFGRRRARTMLELLLFFPPDVVGAVYGISPKTVRLELNDYFGSIDLHDLYICRRKNRRIRETEKGYKLHPEVQEVLDA